MDKCAHALALLYESDFLRGLDNIDEEMEQAKKAAETLMKDWSQPLGIYVTRYWKRQLHTVKSLEEDYWTSETVIDVAKHYNVDPKMIKVAMIQILEDKIKNG